MPIVNYAFVEESFTDFFMKRVIRTNHRDNNADKSNCGFGSFEYQSIMTVFSEPTLITHTFVKYQPE